MLDSTENLKMSGEDLSGLFGVTECPHLFDVRDRVSIQIQFSRGSFAFDRTLLRVGDGNTVLSELKMLPGVSGRIPGS